MGPGPGAGRRRAARGPDCRLRAPPEDKIPGPASWKKRHVRLKNLGWLTWCSLGNTAHTSSAAPEIHVVSKDSHLTLGGISANAFSPAIPAPVRAARRRLRLFIINDAACPHHYDDNYYYCCDFGLLSESGRRRGSRGSGCRAALQARGGRSGPCLERG